MAIKKKYPTLGRGLDALISTQDVKTEAATTISEIPLTQIEPNPDQPRRDFDEQSLQSLTASIKELGIVAPITLRQTAADKYQIVAGERRWRASKRAGLKTIPAYIRTIKDDEVMEMALVENIQREDLNPIEIALAYSRLARHEGATQEKIAERVGKSRAEVANYLRLLRLPALIQMALQKKEISMGHARALLAVENPAQQITLYKQIQKKDYSVRQVEALARSYKSREERQGQDSKVGERLLTEQFDLLRQRLSSFLQTPVAMTISAKGKGKIVIPFDNEDELEHIMSVLDTLKRR